MPAMDMLGQVWDVDGDGNSGFYSLQMGLWGVKGVTDCPGTHTLLRKQLQEYGQGLDDQTQISLVRPMCCPDANESDIRLVWNRGITDLYRSEIPYGDYAFMSRWNDTTKEYLSRCHWFDGSFVIPIVVHKWKVKVVVYLVKSYHMKRGGVKQEKKYHAPHCSMVYEIRGEPPVLKFLLYECQYEVKTPHEPMIVLIQDGNHWFYVKLNQK